MSVMCQLSRWSAFSGQFIVSEYNILCSVEATDENQQQLNLPRGNTIYSKYRTYFIPYQAYD